MASLAWIHAFGLVDLPLLRLDSLLSCLAIFSARQIYCLSLIIKNGRQDDLPEESDSEAAIGSDMNGFARSSDLWGLGLTSDQARLLIILEDDQAKKQGLTPTPVLQIAIALP
ncbi:hypothetical protein CTAM01_02174 [Colletotrichum tamarilloi]|uniref:Uncharacterized protein n=1 Tax=Colletotrichum tamarilloi TaxID=1209934 RepID=A0ABQ9RN40_9PEZI|nr:uncharacterized protein CTAM01_02174 [Colletotrichum tamarilloi]KAK1508388.1 hypothetical protein CTAM01_02174 [Colletotrichum tamarilloi]